MNQTSPAQNSQLSGEDEAQSLKKEYRVAVLGGGSFGTAMANIIADKVDDTRLWMRNEARAKTINETHVNADYLPDTPLNENLKAVTDLAEAVSDCDVVFMAVPSKSSREVAMQVAPYLREGSAVISTTKGIEADTFMLMSEVLQEVLPQCKIGVLSGPNLAKEIAERHISGTVVASPHPEVRSLVQDLLQRSYFRVYDGDDMYGVELAGALKNIYAIISGVAGALGVGANTQGILLTRSLAEMGRFAVKKGANPLTFLGLAGVGDLFVTCTSTLSRNYRVGYALGQGQSLDEVVAELGQVAEGVNTLKLVKQQADKENIYMPLVEALHAVIYERAAIGDVVGTMMSAEQNTDVEFSLSA